MTLHPLGDQAVLARCESPAAAVALASAVTHAAPPWLLDVVPASAAVGVYFDADAVSTAEVGAWLAALPVPPVANLPPRVHTVPVCYELGPDLAAVADRLGLTPDAVATRHAAGAYTVEAVGFAPGFAYLGPVPEALRGVPRLAVPRVRVEAGMVGLTGDRTAVYPLDRPGGWPLVGRTPVTMVDVAAGFFPLRVGDAVRFARVTAADYARHPGGRVTAESRRVSGGGRVLQ